ncbi:MAG: hypothetical protein ACK5IJ_01825 [Mangrovibacterium sp.]
MKTVIQIILVIAALGLTYAIYESIERPIRFEKAKAEKYEKVIARLKEIRSAEIAYKDVNGVFTNNWDTLIHFVNTGELPLVRKIGMLTDSMVEAGWDEKRALKEGKIIRDTLRIAVIDTLFGGNFDASQLRMIPNSTEQFHLGADIVNTGSGVQIPIFEAAAHNNVILADIADEFGQEIINLNDKTRTNGKYPGLKVGSLTEANNNAGNWE